MHLDLSAVCVFLCAGVLVSERKRSGTEKEKKGRKGKERKGKKRGKGGREQEKGIG